MNRRNESIHIVNTAIAEIQQAINDGRPDLVAQRLKDLGEFLDQNDRLLCLLGPIADSFKKIGVDVAPLVRLHPGCIPEEP